MRKPISTWTAATILSLAFALPAGAAHNNPWATPEDDVLAKKHDAKQEQSAGTPDEDEMSGTMDRNITSQPGNRGTGGAGPGGGHGGGGGSMGGGGSQGDR